MGGINGFAAIAEVVRIRIFATEDNSRPFVISRTIDNAGIVIAVASSSKVVGVAIYYVDYVLIATLAVDHVSAPAALDDPEAYAFLSAISLDEKQVNEMEAEINKAGADTPEKGVRNWLKDNQDVVQPWVKAAKEAG
jgi:hypothetical protein